MHNVYKFLRSAPTVPHGKVKWNFEKFLIDPGGIVLKRYAAKVPPKDIEHDIISLTGAV